jgi:signal transduction histidine kinase
VVFRLRGPPADEVLREIRAAQVSSVFRQMPIALAVNAVNAAMTAVVLQRLAEVTLPFGWLCAVVLVTAGRLVVWLRYRRASPREKDDRHWPLLATGGSLLAGWCWGLSGPVLFPILPTIAQMFLTVVIGGMCTGAVVTSAAHLPTILAFLLSASLPVTILFFCQGTSTGSALAAMVVVFVAALALAALHLNRFLADTMRLRFELSRASFRLQAEIAERQAAEAALRQAQKLEVIGQLTGGIAHDFNNLLTIVNGNLTLAMERIGNNSAILPLLRSAVQAAERGGALIHRLLAFARKQRLDPKSVNLSHLVGGIEDLIRRTLRDRVGLATSSDPDLSPARVDANQLELAILNLTINARDAMPSGGSVRINLKNSRTDDRSPPELLPGDYVVVSIRDTGTGMDEEMLARAFEPFFTTKELGMGSGLGLPMVQGFAAQSGGAVQIRSKLGEGTTVELWLPQANEPPPENTGNIRSPFVVAPGAAPLAG